MRLVLCDLCGREVTDPDGCERPRCPVTIYDLLQKAGDASDIELIDARQTERESRKAAAYEYLLRRIGLDARLSGYQQ